MLPSEQNSYVQRLRTFSHELTSTVDLVAILRILREHINSSLSPERMHIFVYDAVNDQYKAAPGEDGLSTCEFLFPMTSSLVQVLANTDTPIFYSEDSLLPGSASEQSRLIRLGARVFVPLPGSDHPVGWLALGAPHTGEAYTPQDLAFLNQVGNMAALAISHAQLVQEAQAASEAKSEFVSFVAHELKNPMTSIMGYTELLSKEVAGPITEMQANFLSTIHTNVERMSTLVTELNDHSEIEANRLRLDFKAVDIAEVVDEVMRSIKRQMDDRNQSGRINLPASLPKVRADRTRLVQVITNLVSNAHKYTPDGGIVIIGAGQSANQWDPQGAPEVVHIWVQDNGIGISLEDQKKIFQKFFRSDDLMAHEAPGTGLGLNITKSLIEMMGGRIWIESEFRQGTTFHFTVPVAER